MFRLLRLLLGLLGLALVAIPAGLVALILVVPQDRPLVARAAEPTPEAVGRAHALLKRHDPRYLPPGAQGRLGLTQEEVDLALAALPPPLRSRIRLQGATAAVELTAELPFPGRYLNVSTEVVNDGEGLGLHGLRLGAVPVPDWLAGGLARLGWERLREHPDWGAVARALEGMHLENSGLRVAYRVPDGFPEHLRGLALPPAELAALRAQHHKLAQTLAEARGPLPLPRLLAPLFALAEERGGGADEYRAALLAVGAPLAGQSLAVLIPEARTWPALPRRTVILAGRVDSAQHFAVSALIASQAGTPLANAVGVWKELEDSRGGSGFSFADLAADLAGTRMGEALVNPGGPRLARKLAAGLPEDSLVPRLSDLPENLDRTAFQARYGGPGDPRYETLVVEIENRLAALASAAR